MNHSLNRALFVAQRLSAMLLAPLVLLHLALIMVAIKNGLTGDEILSRTRGNFFWGAFYSVFVLAAATHAPIGLRNILKEWTNLQPRIVDVVVALLFVLMLWSGMRAVVAVI